MNIASKDILARLLASENITVVHKSAPTASFNVRDRVLTLPMWDNMQADTYDHLVGHEVGHALYTPEAGWHESASSKGKIYRQYLNIVEDARIEKMVQTRYPGLRRSFISSYKRMLADGFFGGSIIEINRFSFIDRINTYFKVGRSAGVRIDRDEMVWIKKIEQLQTWEEVVALTDELFAFCKERNEDDRAAANQAADEEDYADAEDDSPESETDGDGEQAGDEESDDDSDGETESDEKGTGDEETDEEEDEDGDEDYDGEESAGSGHDRDDSDDDVDEEIASRTDELLRKSISAEHGDDPNVEVTSVNIPNTSIDDFIITADVVNDMFTESQYAAVMNAYGKALYKKFMVDNKPAVKYMAKEFEMKKSAAAYARQTVSKTGVIDPVKMNSYRYNDDIFRKVSITPDGKDHGMIMYVDWSGSMASQMKATIDQMLNLVLFCRQVNIPFRVYAFTDRFDSIEKDNVNHISNADDRQMTYDPRFRLIEFFSNEMNRAKFTKMMENLLVLGKYYSQYESGGRQYVNYHIPHNLTLGSTPLNESIMAAFKIHDDFKKKTRVDIVNTMFLTDGDSNTSFYYNANMYDDGRDYQKRLGGAFNYTGSKILYMTDPVTKKRKRVTGQRDAVTKTLLEFYREQTGSTTIGYRIMPAHRHRFRNSLPSSVSYDESYGLYSSVRKNKFAVIPDSGYDRLYLIAGGTNLKTSNGAIEVERGESKRSVRTAFKKANTDKKTSRKMLSDLIDAIA